jgi:hypothetical protein
VTFLLETVTDGVDLVVTDDWSPAARAAFEDGRADGLVLNYARGFREQPVDFIEGLPIRRLNLLARSVTDLSPVYSLASSLNEFRVQSDPRAVIELERLPGLRALAASWPQIQGSIMFARQLESLSVPSYAESDLNALTNLSALTKLVMKERPKLSSLDGFEAFSWLAHLGVHWARNLEDITALERAVSPTLQVLQLPSCKKVTDVGPVASCRALTFFELSEAAEVQTIAPLSDLVALESLYLYGSTRVADGDLGPIASLPLLRDFRMVNRRGYTPSTDDIKATIASRS